MQEGQIESLVGGLKSHMLLVAAEKWKKIPKKQRVFLLLRDSPLPSTQLLKLGRFPALPFSYPCQLCLLNHSHIWPLFTPSLEKGMATHSSILAWRIPWTEEPEGLQTMGTQRVRHDWATNTFTRSQLLPWSRPCSITYCSN